jgi:hypothetical protein
MTIKESENQLVLNLNAGFVVVVILWLTVFGYIGYQLWALNTQVVLPPANTTQIPSINQEDIETLRASLKSLPGGSLPVVRAEPFD